MQNLFDKIKWSSWQLVIAFLGITVALIHWLNLLALSFLLLTGEGIRQVGQVDADWSGPNSPGCISGYVIGRDELTARDSDQSVTGMFITALIGPSTYREGLARAEAVCIPHQRRKYVSTNSCRKN